ncbi:hypothetical protein TWF281_006434 [Arthrobotrys megalospora]
MTSSTDSIDPLILQNRIAVVAAQRRKLIESLLTPPTAEELKNAKSTEEIAAEEEELWKPRPATLGAGHPVPMSASATETYNREHDLLRRRLLGQSIMKDARQRHQERTLHQSRSRDVDNSESSDDDEEQTGRGAISKKASKKRKFKTDDEPQANDEVTDTHNSGSGSDTGVSGGFVSLTTKSVTPKGKKIKSESKNSKHDTAFRGSTHDDGESDAEATDTNTKVASTNSPTQRALTGEKIVVVGENKKRKKKKKRKNKSHSAES